MFFLMRTSLSMRTTRWSCKEINRYSGTAGITVTHFVFKELPNTALVSERLIGDCVEVVPNLCPRVAKALLDEARVVGLQVVDISDDDAELP